MDKQFKVGGVSKCKSGYKVRFANDMTRVKILAKTDSDINLIELPNEMTKPEMVTYLKTTDLYANANYRDAIDAADAKYNGTVAAKATKVKAVKAAVTKAAKPAVKAKAKPAAKGKTVKAKAEKPTLAGIKAKVAKAKAAEAVAEAAPAAETPAAVAAESVTE